MHLKSFILPLFKLLFISIWGLSIITTNLKACPFDNKEFFSQTISHHINVADYQTQTQNWLQQQEPIKVNFIVLKNKNDIVWWLKNNLNIHIQHVNNLASYNSYQSLALDIPLQTPPQEIFGLYIEPRNNPFQAKYKTKPLTLKLDDFLQYQNQKDLAIKNIFIFINFINANKNISKYLSIIQPNLKVQVHEYNIHNREQGYKILEQNGININKNNSHAYCSMNQSSNNDINGNFDKTNYENVDFIYCVNRDDKSYSTNQTLDYYQNQPDIIKDLYIFYQVPSPIEIHQIICSHRWEMMSALRRLGYVVLWSFSNASYNSFNSNFITVRFKNPPPNLVGVYIISHPDTKEKYPALPDTYTLDDLKKYQQAIKTMYIFEKSV